MAIARRLVRVAAVLIVGALVPAAAASAGEVFTIAGGPPPAGPPRVGALATAVRFGQIEQIAAAPDGGVVIVDWRCCQPGEDRVWKLEPDGRLQLLAIGGFSRNAPHGDGVPAAGAWLGDVTDVAVVADGTIYLAAGCRIRRIDAAGLIWTVAGQDDERACASTGDGGPATAARVNAGRIALSPRGILVADGCRIREIGLNGIIRALAGRARCRILTDTGGRFRQFDEGIIGLAAAPDGAAIVLDGTALWRVGFDGRVSRLMALGRISYDAVDTLADGSVLVGGLGGVLRRVTPGGHVETLTRHGSPLLSAFDGDGAPIESWFVASDLAATADGGWLAAQGDRIRYVAPGEPALFALGIAGDTVRSGLPLRVSLVTTAPAHVVLEARVRGRRTGALALDVPAGHTSVNLPGGSAHDLTAVAATATSLGPTPRVARDRLAVLAGDTLPRSVAERIMARWAAQTRAIGGGERGARCRRFAPRRIDCEAVDELCQFAVSFKLRRDGILTAREYRHPAGRCRLRSHPRWRGPRYGIELPLSEPLDPSPG